MRHAAWLSAGQVVNTKDGQQRKPSRMADAQADGVDQERPPLTDSYLVECLFDAGPVLPGGMGVVPLGFVDLRAWQHAMGLTLTPWQAKTLRRLSCDYVAASQAAESPDCPSPWAPEIEPPDREQVAKKVQGAFRMLMNTRPKK